MNAIRLAVAACLAGVLGVTAHAFAASFSLSENGAKAQGMAGAFVGQADDPSAVWYNPAGLLRTKKGGVLSLGANLFIPDFSANDVNGVRTNIADDRHADGESGSTPMTGNQYVSWRVNDRVAVGLGVNTPFGLSVDWDDDAFVRYQSAFAELRTLFVTPAIAVQLSDRIAAGLGVSYVYADAELERKIFFGPGLEDGTFQMAGQAREWAYDAGVQAVLVEGAGALDRLTLGATYHSAVSLGFERDDSVIRFTVPAAFTSAFPNSAVSANIDLPEIWTVGFSAELGGRTTVNLDVSRVMWETFRRVVFVAENPVTQALVSPIVRNYHNTWVARLGGEHRFNDSWAMRLGYAYDETPIPDKTLDPLLPDANRHLVTVGLGYTYGRFSVDAAYSAFFFQDISTSTHQDGFNVDYESFSHVVSLAVNYHF
jgi:long-chain fatty acid transport protein